MARRQCVQHTRMVGKFAHQLLPGLSDYPLLWEDGLGRVGLQSLARLSRAVSAATRPVRDFGQQIERTQNGLAQGFSVSKDRLSRRSARWLCTRALIVGTGDFGFSTVHRLFNGTRRRPPKVLWSDFIRHIIQRLDPHRAVTEFDSLAQGRALIVVKRGRRAVLGSAYDELREHVQHRLQMPTQFLEPSLLTVREQLHIAGQVVIAVSPDGGTSFVCAFMPQGAAVIILGFLEKYAVLSVMRCSVLCVS
mmetsp:Transcript_63329/g.141166  ORF Transcript_63329/g.141166 Transcript_63329/m.141166 type:complete len:249 (+) Transcript_63329:1008-1754(+)